MENGNKIGMWAAIGTAIASAFTAVWATFRNDLKGVLWILAGGFVSLDSINIIPVGAYVMMICFIAYRLTVKK